MEQSDWLILGIGPLAAISRVIKTLLLQLTSVPIISEIENNSYIFTEFTPGSNVALISYFL